jgi:hypothetical protein
LAYNGAANIFKKLVLQWSKKIETMNKKVPDFGEPPINIWYESKACMLCWCAMNPQQQGMNEHQKLSMDEYIAGCELLNSCTQLLAFLKYSGFETEFNAYDWIVPLELCGFVGCELLHPIACTPAHPIACIPQI